MNKTVVSLVVAVIVAVAVFFIFSERKSDTASKSETSNFTEEKVEETLVNEWKEIELTNTNTGEKFKVSDFTGKTILLESFAVWCPVCLKQQREMEKFKDIEGDNIVIISIDIDPNEDEDQVKEYVIRNGFDWHFIVSPKEMTQELIDKFGDKVVNPSQAPIVLICEEQTARLMDKRGIKSPEDLQEEINSGC